MATQSTILSAGFALTLALAGAACPSAAQEATSSDADAAGNEGAVPRPAASGEAAGDWGVGRGEGCEWIWDPPTDVTTHMRAASEGTKTWTAPAKGASDKVREAAWARLLDVAIQHASVALAAARLDPGAATSPDGESNAVDAASTATTIVHDAVRAHTPPGAGPTWSRYAELSYLREVLRSMSGDYLVQPLAGSAADMRFAVQDEVWRPRIDRCRAHRLQMSARKGPS